VDTLALIKISGLIFMGGDTINFSLIISTTYSSKVITISLLLKSVARFRERFFKTTGISLSFGPPAGTLIFAHPRIP